MSESDDQIPLVRRHQGRVETRLVDLPFARRLLQTPGILQGENEVERGHDAAWRHFDLEWRGAHPTAMAPNEQGLVVLDHDTRWIGTSGELETGSFFGMSLLVSRMASSNLLRPSFVGYEGMHLCFEEAWRLGWVRHVCVMSPRGALRPEIRRPLRDFGLLAGGSVAKAYAILAAEHIHDAAHPESDQDTRIALTRTPVDGEQGPLIEIVISRRESEPTPRIMGFSYDPKGWALRAFRDSPAGWRAFCCALIRRDLPFSGAAGRAWEIETERRFLERHPRSAHKGQGPSPLALQLEHRLRDEVAAGRPMPPRRL